MTTRTWLSHTILAGLMMAFGAQAAAAAPADGRLQLSVGPLRVSQQNDAVLAKTSIAEAGMLHRFHVEVVNAAGVAVSTATAWVVEIRLEGCASACLRFTSDMSAVSLPRPLGLRVEAGTAVTVTAAITSNEDAAEPLFVRVNVEYDAVEAGITRLAVTPLAARGSVGGDASQRTWELRASANARLLALAGPAIGQASDLALLDVESGEIVWRASNRGAPLAFASSNPYVRLGAALIEGRTYRLTAGYAREVPAGDASILVLARASGA